MSGRSLPTEPASSCSQSRCLTVRHHPVDLALLRGVEPRDVGLEHPAGSYEELGSRRGIRTHTGGALDAVPLPLG